MRILAAGSLFVALFVPLVRLDGAGTSAWQIVLGDWPSLFLVGLAYLWPFIALILASRPGRGRIATVIQLAEPVLAAASTLFILWLPGMFWEYESSFLPWLWIPKSASPAAGAYLAVGANGLYLLAWLGEVIRGGNRSR
jgi:hypothetical protein